MLNFPTYKKIAILCVCLFGIFYAMPTFLPGNHFADLPGIFPGKKVNLGLDLQGGAHLLLEVEVDAALDELLQANEDEVRRLLRRERIRYDDLQISDQSVVVRIKQADEKDKARSRILETLAEVSVTSIDDNRLRIALPEAIARDRRQAVVGQTIEIIRRRIDELGTREPIIQRQGATRIIVQVPGEDDPQRLKGTLGTTAKMSFHLVHADYPPGVTAPTNTPPGSIIMPGNDEDDPIRYVIERRVRVSGDHLVDAQPTYDQNQPAVSFRFDTRGARLFGQTTQDNVRRNLAIVLDGKVISAPVVNEPILGGSGIISGQFSVSEANDLALLLRAGALPAPITVLEERTVGPGLGQDSIDAGKMAVLIGFIAVMAYMGLTYGLFGMMANIALLLNIGLIVAILALLQATLTLPGIAGIVLTMGMAVDANVLIFERIREEQRAGRMVVHAIDAGYRQALTTIIDSNLTTLIAAMMLFAFGSGPVRGFAVTLGTGIIASMFTAIMVTRWLMVLWFTKYRPKRLEL